MSNQVQNYNLSAKISESVEAFSDEVHQKMLDKQAEYNASMNRLSIFTAKKNSLRQKYLSAKEKFMQGKDCNFNSLKFEYNSVSATHFEAEMNSDILRDSLMSAIYYNAKMRSC